MSYWLAAAAIVFAVEMFLGTVYLLVLSAALAGASLAALFFGADTAAPWLAASLLSLVGVAKVYGMRRRAAAAPDTRHAVICGKDGIVLLLKTPPTNDDTPQAA